MASYLAEASNFITQATFNGCRVKELCTVDVLGVIQAFMNLANYMASLAYSCAPAVNEKAVCAADITGIIAAVAEASLAAAGLNDCTTIFRRLEGASDKDNASGSISFQEHLADLEMNASSPVRRLPDGPQSVNIAWCVISMVNGPLYLAQAVNNIIASVGDDCTAAHAAGELRSSKEKTCAADISSVIASFGDVASYLATTASTCTQTLNVPANCAAWSGSLVNALGSLAGCSVDISMGNCAMTRTAAASTTNAPGGLVAAGGSGGEDGSEDASTAGGGEDATDLAFAGDTHFLSPNVLVGRSHD